MRNIYLSFDWNHTRIRITSARLQTAEDADELIRIVGALRITLPGGAQTAVPGEDSVIAHAQPIPGAPTPLPEATVNPVAHVDDASEAKTSDQDALSSASGETQDRWESVSPPIPEPEIPGSTETPASSPGSEAAVDDADAAPAGEASRPDASPAPVDHYALDTADLDRSRTLLANCIECRARIYEGDVYSVIGPNAEYHCVDCIPDHEKAPDPALAGEPSTSPAPLSTRQRVKQLHDEHPEYTRREAWEALGITEGSLAGHSYALGIKWKLLEPVKFERPAPPPPREDAIAPDETVTPSNGFSAPRPSRPKGTQLRLRAGRGEGKYLHMSGVGMTDNKTYAWIGTEAHLLKLRQKFPDARDLVEEVVEKEPAR